MHCPRLRDLPPPPPGRTGWPWTEESVVVPETTEAGTVWPKISVVTPSFNQGEFIEETIRSVLLQGYPDIEYSIIDGGSSDQTIEIIKKYEPWLTYWVSEKDNGQSSAINKGWRRTTGKIVSYLNSDDTLRKDALSVVGTCFERNPETGLIYGDSVFVSHQGQILNTYKGRPYNQRSLFCWSLNIGQPAVFFRQQIFSTTGYLNEDLRYVMDFDFWLRVSIHHPFLYIPVPLATMRLHSGAKTVRDFSLFYLDELKSLHAIFLLVDPGTGIRQYEQMACAHSYLRAGYRDFQMGNMREARHLILTALQKYPRFLLNPSHLFFIMMTFLPTQFVRKVYRAKACLLKRKNFIDLLLESDT